MNALTPSPLDHRFPFTIFEDVHGRSKREREGTLRKLAEAVAKLVRKRKDEQALVKLAAFGSLTTDKGSLRHDANAVAVYGAEGDYDGGVVTIDQALDRLRAAGIACLIYSTSRHTAAVPRWRVFCIFSRALEPSERAHMCARLNGALGGILAGESFALSQSYYFGRLEDATDFRVELLDGRFIDLADDLDAGAIGKAQQPKAVRAKRAAKDDGSKPDRSRLALRIAYRVRREGGCIADFEAALTADPHTAEWLKEKGLARNKRELGRTWDLACADEPEWMQACQRDSKGALLCNLLNIATAIRLDPALEGSLYWCELRRSVMLRASVPGSNAPPITRDREWHDADVSAFQEYLQSIGFLKASRDTVQQALELVASEHPRHILREYFDALEWDEKPRLDTWLIRYAGAADTPAVRGIGRMFLIAAVARLYAPGCKADYLLVLEGPQGAGKSGLCRILGGDFYGDNLPDLRSGKDVSLYLRGNWIIEAPELSALDKSETNALKEFVTRQEERYRPPYGRLEVTEPRQCVLIGTTNKSVYLRDETGGRRFWPVAVGTIDHAALARDRDMLLAEALFQYQLGEPWWPDPAFERQYLAPEQEARFEADGWQSRIAEYLNDKDVVADLAEVARGGLGLDSAHITRAATLRIAGILERLGWVRGKPTKTSRPWGRCASR